MLVVGKVQNVYRMIDKGNYMKTIIMNMKDCGILVCQQHIRKQRRHACLGIEQITFGVWLNAHVRIFLIGFRVVFHDKY